MPRSSDLEPALNACQTQLELTFSASDSLDTKALGLIGFDIALLIFVLQSDMLKNPLVLILSLAAFGISLLFSIKIISPKDYIGAIVDLTKHQEYLKLSRQQLVLQLLADTQKAISINTNLNNNKSKCCVYALSASLAWTIFLAGCII